jgi:hypothetical protein
MFVRVSSRPWDELGALTSTNWEVSYYRPMTKREWAELLNRRAGRIHSKKTLGPVRSAGWRSADARLIRAMERDPQISRAEMSNVLASYRSSVRSALVTRAAYPGAATWTRDTRRAQQRAYRRARLGERVIEVSGWAISPLYGHRRDR